MRIRLKAIHKQYAGYSAANAFSGSAPASVVPCTSLDCSGKMIMTPASARGLL